MGYPHSEVTSLDGYSARFCDHVLRIEISGAEIHNLRIVDLPGLVHSKCRKPQDCILLIVWITDPTKYQTLEDIKIVKDLMSYYLENSHNIILFVAHYTLGV